MHQQNVNLHSLRKKQQLQQQQQQIHKVFLYGKKNPYNVKVMP